MWYAIQVAGGKEETTCRLIDRFVEPGIVQEVFTPRYETQKKVRGAWLRSSSVLFPGYVIAVTHKDAYKNEKVDRLRRALHGVPEFTRLLTAGETYLPLDEREQALVCAFTRPGDRTVEMSMGIMDGDRVVVTSGPLLGREGLIRSVNRRKSIAYLEIEMFGRTLKTKVGLGIVAKRAVPA